jgi:hypothetical protein
MSDELKDFRYYADKAEEQLIDSQSYVKSTHSFDAATHKIGIAAVYAELAKAAPKTEPVPCNVGLHGYVGGSYIGTSRPCIFMKGHTGDHRTDDGVFFKGLDNVDFPGPKGND